MYLESEFFESLKKMREKGDNEGIVKLEETKNKRLEELKQNTGKTKMFLENMSRELSKFARKDDVEILAKQLKMFQPLKYIKEK